MRIKAPAQMKSDMNLFDLDLEIGVEKSVAGPAITSISYCTPGCTSEGGGSGCSHCCDN
ncbi:gallidermin/nisin family lantibiotic [Streptomyces sp. NPDC001339]|uniref:gallidermin/nisin family lantibiotic n=1 Tax=Streptomyces sp. NPDC001339 TaxID=3364563 RepID=UPI0036CF9104